MRFQETSPLWNMLADAFAKLPILSLVLSCLIVYMSALLLNNLLTGHGLIPKNSLLAGFFYILLIGSSYHFHQLNPIIVVNLLIILEMYYLFQLYTLREAYKVAFSVGFITSLAFLVYPPAIYLIIPIYLIYMTMGNLSWREWLIPLIAFSLPLVYVGVYYFWIGKSVMFLNTIIKDFTYFRIFHFHFDILNWIKIVIILPLFIFSFIGVLNNIASKNIDLRKKTFAMMHFLIFSSLIFLFVVFPYRQFSLLFAPLAAFMSLWLSEKKKILKYEIAILLVIIISLIDNYKILQYF